ncbi:MAG: 23S rRNA (pseudouridine(1915)-N(3))-methyltransferase RlmH [Patescibacteria group bacterium]|nr:23S rRNA (pseudouridine(1915)-N(3))-methyltransferase RlmH [Patescibacteria group bacterium]
MNVTIISPGRKHDPETAALIAEYEKRLRDRFDISWHFPRPDSIDSESASIARLLSKKDFVILLDEHGKDLTSVEFADVLALVQNRSPKRLVFIIGGAYGVGEDIKKRANATISLSSLTFPHMLVRLILTEQLYRASEIMRGGKYHH